MMVIVLGLNPLVYLLFGLKLLVQEGQEVREASTGLTEKAVVEVEVVVAHLLGDVLAQTLYHQRSLLLLVRGRMVVRHKQVWRLEMQALLVELP